MLREGREARGGAWRPEFIPPGAPFAMLSARRFPVTSASVASEGGGGECSG